jgi:hypothetical protein
MRYCSYITTILYRLELSHNMVALKLPVLFYLEEKGYQIWTNKIHNMVIGNHYINKTFVIFNKITISFKNIFIIYSM